MAFPTDPISWLCAKPTGEHLRIKSNLGNCVQWNHCDEVASLWSVMPRISEHMQFLASGSFSHCAGMRVMSVGTIRDSHWLSEGHNNVLDAPKLPLSFARDTENQPEAARISRVLACLSQGAVDLSSVPLVCLCVGHIGHIVLATPSLYEFSE